MFFKKQGDYFPLDMYLGINYTKFISSDMLDWA